MITLTAVIKPRSGSADLIRAALIEVGRHASRNEPDTVSYFVTEAAERGTFVTHERYVDQAALDAHNDGPGAKAFFAASEGHIEALDVHIGPEIFP